VSIPPIHPLPAPAAQAHLTLRRAAHTLAATDYAGPVSAAARYYRARSLGNHLRELDRFLRTLIEAITPAPARAALRTARRTGDKLSQLDTGLACSSPRLDALRGARNCLYYCGGRVRRGDRRHSPLLTLGWPRDRPRRARLGEELTITQAELADICAFYLELADSLVESRP
jgi:hypothetical protein